MDLVKFQLGALPLIDAYLAQHKRYSENGFRLTYCTNAVLDDFSALERKDYFIWDASIYGGNHMYDIDEVPLKVGVYANNLPTAYILGRIEVGRNAFEIDYSECSNFYPISNSGGWVQLLTDILGTLKLLIDEADIGVVIHNIAIVAPAPYIVDAFLEAGFELKVNYCGSKEAVVLNLLTK